MIFVFLFLKIIGNHKQILFSNLVALSQETFADAGDADGLGEGGRWGGGGGWREPSRTIFE